MAPPWTTAILTAVLALSSACTASGNQQSSRPLVRVKNPKFKTVLSLDGDPFRAMTGAVVLAAMEQAIKDVIVAKKLTNYTDPGQFDILLSDYFDVMAGTSGGGFSVSYLATHGASFPSLYNTSGTGASRPGSASGLVEYWAWMSGVFNSVPWNSTYAYQVELGNAFSAFFQQAFKGITTHSFNAFHTSAFWTWTDLANMNLLYNFINPKAKRAGLVRPAATSEPDEFLPDADFDLWTVTRGTGAYAPAISPIKATTTASTPASAKQTLTIADGCLGTIFPGIVAVPHMILYDKVPASSIAVLSIGSTALSPQLDHQDFLRYIWAYPNSWQGGFNTSCLGSRVAPVQMIESTLGSAADGRFVRLDLQFENRTSCLGVNATTCQAIKTAVVESTLTDLATRAYFDIAELLWDTYNSTVYGWISSWLV